MCFEFLKNINWQTTASIATTLALLIAIIALICQTIESRITNEFVIFSRYQETLAKISEKRRNTWLKIKEKTLSNPKTKHEIPDKSNSFDYLNLRIKQQEPLYAIEQQLIEEEIRTINILNEICKYALKDTKKLTMTKILYSSEISFYQSHIDDLLRFIKHCLNERLFPKPKYGSIKKVKIDDYFGK